MILIDDLDIKWLNKNYSILNVDTDRISGIISFKATYNPERNLFLNLKDGVINDIEGLILEGQFEIEVKERARRITSRLPALHVKNVEPITVRHFNQTDGSACLCSPFEEDRFILPVLKMEIFFERLVVPFLYGQLYYNNYNKWPWFEYDHGSIGLLQSYAKVESASKSEECLRLLKTDVKNWLDVKSIMIQKSPIGGHILCFCPKKYKMRQCHPDALEGIKKLREHLLVKDVKLNSE